MSAWNTPPRKGALILLAHGYGDNRPEWIHAMLEKKGYRVLSWDARAHVEISPSISTCARRLACDKVKRKERSAHHQLIYIDLKNDNHSLDFTYGWVESNAICAQVLRHGSVFRVGGRQVNVLRSHSKYSIVTRSWDRS